MEPGVSEVRPQIKAVDHRAKTVLLTNEEARYVLATDPQIRHEWQKWVGVSGQARLPISERRGSLVIVDPDRLNSLRRRDRRDSGGGAEEV